MKVGRGDLLKGKAPRQPNTIGPVSVSRDNGSRKSKLKPSGPRSASLAYGLASKEPVVSSGGPIFSVKQRREVVAFLERSGQGCSISRVGTPPFHPDGPRLSAPCGRFRPQVRPFDASFVSCVRTVTGSPTAERDILQRRPVSNVGDEAVQQSVEDYQRGIATAPVLPGERAAASVARLSPPRTMRMQGEPSALNFLRSSAARLEPEPEPEPQPEPEPVRAALMDSSVFMAAPEDRGMMNMEGAEGPEADEAWRSLVAEHPDATVIDDFMIALPSSEEQQAVPLEPEPEPDLMLKAESDEPYPMLEPVAKQSPDLAATPLSDPKTSSSKDSKDDTSKEQKEMRFEAAAAVISEADEDLNNSGEIDSPRTSRQKLTAAQSEAAEELAEKALRNAVIEIVADAQAAQRKDGGGGSGPSVAVAIDPLVGLVASAPDEALPPSLEKTTQAAWRRMSRSYGVQQVQQQGGKGGKGGKTAREVQTQRRNVKKQGQSQAQSKPSDSSTSRKGGRPGSKTAPFFDSRTVGPADPVRLGSDLAVRRQ